MEGITEVYLIVAESLSKERNTMGWNIERDISGIKILVAPSSKEIQEIYETGTNSMHFYSGIRSFSFVYTSFKIGLKHNIKRGLIVEHPFTYKKPLILHIIRTLLLDLKYFKRIQYVFSIGERAKKWFLGWNKDWKVIPFCYCVEPPLFNVSSPIIGNNAKLLFVGSLIPLKNIQLILEALHSIKANNFKLDLIGDGPEKKNLEKLCKNYDLENAITFHGIKERKEIFQIITDYDILILPSLMDGWGAVVNEALMAGLFVICSNKCGAQALIDADRKRGLIFDAKSKKDLAEKLNWSISNINTIRSEKEQRHKWSECISGESIAEYFVKSLGESTVTPPWTDLKN